MVLRRPALSDPERAPDRARAGLFSVWPTARFIDVFSNLYTF